MGVGLVLIGLAALGFRLSVVGAVHRSRHPRARSVGDRRRPLGDVRAELAAFASSLMSSGAVIAGGAVLLGNLSRASARARRRLRGWELAHRSRLLAPGGMLVGPYYAESADTTGEHACP